MAGGDLRSTGAHLVYNAVVKRAFHPLSACLLAIVACACEARAPEPTPAPPPTAPDPELEDGLGRVIARLQSEIAPSWVRFEKPFRGELRARERQSFLVVLKYGHCYRVIGAGGAGVTDLDLVLLDSNGVEVQRDVTRDATPTIGVKASLCPGDAGAYRIDVRMAEGQGPFVAAVFRDPS